MFDNDFLRFLCTPTTPSPDPQPAKNPTDYIIKYQGTFLSAPFKGLAISSAQISGSSPSNIQSSQILFLVTDFFSNLTQDYSMIKEQTSKLSQFKLLADQIKPNIIVSCNPLPYLYLSHLQNSNILFIQFPVTFYTKHKIAIESFLPRKVANQNFFVGYFGKCGKTTFIKHPSILHEYEILIACGADDDCYTDSGEIRTIPTDLTDEEIHMEFFEAIKLSVMNHSKLNKYFYPIDQKQTDLIWKSIDPYKPEPLSNDSNAQESTKTILDILRIYQNQPNIYYEKSTILKRVRVKSIFYSDEVCPILDDFLLHMKSTDLFDLIIPGVYKINKYCIIVSNIITYSINNSHPRRLLQPTINTTPRPSPIIPSSTPISIPIGQILANYLIDTTGSAILLSSTITSSNDSLNLTSLYQSLIFSDPFHPVGGRSNSIFYKTVDVKYLIKRVSQSEGEFIWNHFQVIDQYIHSKGRENQHQSLLVPIYLVSKIDGNYWIVISNINTSDVIGKSSRYIFDLKGIRNRRIPESPTSSSSSPSASRTVTGWDDNLWEYLDACKLHINVDVHRLLTDDVNFLMNELKVIDYSLLLIVNETTLSLSIGVIDYFRLYTWDKQIEYAVKKTVVTDSPTIIDPNKYGKRFIDNCILYFNRYSLLSV
jgi:Phosphatidylinositol-4-phosphate 5-Kinase